MRTSRFSEEQIVGILKEHAAGRPHSALGYQTLAAFAREVARAAASLPERDGLSYRVDQLTSPCYTKDPFISSHLAFTPTTAKLFPDDRLRIRNRTNGRECEYHEDQSVS